MSWWKTAKVGDRVVFVDDEPPVNDWHRKNMLVVGDVYEIQNIEPITNFETGESRIGFAVEDSGRLWDAKRFRPIQPKSTETGMSILKRILNGAPVREDA